MTQKQALKEMRMHGRDVMYPVKPEQWAKAFGFSLADLGIKAVPLKNFPIIYSPEDADKPSIATDHFVTRLCEKITGERPTTGMLGHGSAADDLTFKSCEAIAKHFKLA